MASKQALASGATKKDAAFLVVQLSRKLRVIYRISRRRVLSSVLVGLLSAAVPQFAAAMPQGGQVAAGTGTITQVNPANLRINQASQSLIVNWQGFSIAAGERVQFVQPSSSSVALNRVLGQDPSQIFGSLSANGQVFLLNPNGMYIGRTAQIDAQSFVGSSLGMRDADFLSGNYVFSRNGAAGRVVNEGAISTPGGYTALIGTQVVNDGVISARLGSVGLAAGDQVSMDFKGDGLMNIKVDRAAVYASIQHKGLIAADGGRVMMTAQSANALLDTVLNVEGVVRANTLAERNGVIVLEGCARGVASVTGSILATGANAGETGGTAMVLGDRVVLAGAGSINVSGAAAIRPLC